MTQDEYYREWLIACRYIALAEAALTCSLVPPRNKQRNESVKRNLCGNPATSTTSTKSKL